MAAAAISHRKADGPAWMGSRRTRQGAKRWIVRRANLRLVFTCGEASNQTRHPRPSHLNAATGDLDGNRPSGMMKCINTIRVFGDRKWPTRLP